MFKVNKIDNKTEIIIDESGKYLIHDEKIICRIDNEDWFTCNAIDNNLMEYIKIFIEKHADNLNCHYAEMCYKDNVAIHIYSGEMIDLLFE